MLRTLKSIAAITLLVEVTAALTLFLLGNTTLHRLFSIPITPATVQEKHTGGRESRCTPYGGELFCIKEEL